MTSEARPVLERGNNAAVVIPPVREAAIPLITAIPRRPILVLALDADRAADLADGVPGAFAATSHARARQRLSGTVPEVVCVGVPDAVQLLERSVLKPGAFASVVLAWPDQLDEPGLAALETVMAECDREAQRLLLVAAPGQGVQQLVERYAFKAMTWGFPPDGGQPPAPDAGPARYVLARRSAFAEVSRRILDALNPASDDEVRIVSCPASRDEAREIGRSGPAPVIVAEPHQLAWLRSVFAPLSPLPLPAASLELEQRAEALRARLARVIETGNLDRELFQVGPLLSQFDPAVVAAAALRLAQEAAPRNQAAPAPAQQHPAQPTRIWVGIGRKDNVRPGDLVGALANEARVPAEAIGKIEVRELFSLVEVKSGHAEQAVKGLSGVTVRGRRLTVRMDRGPGAKPPRRV